MQVHLYLFIFCFFFFSIIHHCCAQSFFEETKLSTGIINHRYKLQLQFIHSQTCTFLLIFLHLSFEFINQIVVFIIVSSYIHRCICICICICTPFQILYYIHTIFHHIVSPIPFLFDPSSHHISITTMIISILNNNKYSYMNIYIDLVYYISIYLLYSYESMNP